MGAFVFFSLVTGLYATYGSRMNIASILANLYDVTPGVSRSAQPFTSGQWESIFARRPFKTVINLRGDNPKAQWYRDELAVCAAHECVHHDVLLSSKRLPSREVLLTLLNLIENEPKPLLLKCAGGAERTGLASVLWVLSQGMGVDAARSHLRAFPYLHIPKKQQRWIREFLAFYIQTCDGLTMRKWLETVYSDQALAKFMIDQGKGDYWRTEWK